MKNFVVLAVWSLRPPLMHFGTLRLHNVVRSGVSRSILREEAFVQTLELDGTVDAHADIMFDHQGRKLGAADVSQARIMAIIGHHPGTTALKAYD